MSRAGLVSGVACERPSACDPELEGLERAGGAWRWIWNFTSYEMGYEHLRLRRLHTSSPVLLLSAEDPHGVVVERLSGLTAARHIALASLPLHVIVIVEHPVRLPDQIDRLAATVEKHRPGLPGFSTLFFDAHEPRQSPDPS